MVIIYYIYKKETLGDAELSISEWLEFILFNTLLHVCVQLFYLLVFKD